MYLSRVYIKNYRSIKELDLSFLPGKNVIVGRNNSGKSNVINAINLILSEFYPAGKSESISHTDFYSWKEQSNTSQVAHTSNEIYIWCELTRQSEELLNFEEMYKATRGFYIYSRYGGPTGQEPIRLDRSWLPMESDVIFEPNQDDNREKEYVKSIPEQSTFEHKLNPMHNFAFAFRAIRDQDNIIHKEMRFLFREGPELDWVLCFFVPFRNELLQSAVIPSFRDPYNQLRLTNWSWYGKLLRHLTKNYDENPALRDAFDRVNEVSGQIFSEITETVSRSTLSVAFPGTSLEFQFNSDRKDDLFRSTVIYVDDGFKSQLTEKGSGIQSATIIGLFNYFTTHVNTITSALLCIEEPEIYLHPHARRIISDRLDEFLGGERNQVILTTHSAEFIRTTRKDFNIISTRRVGDSTRVKSIHIQDLADILIDSNQNELFFADKVIICENTDSHLLRVMANHLYPGRLDSANISIISAGDKNSIPSLVKKLMPLEMPIFVFADFDFFLRDMGEEAKNYDKSRQCITNLGLPYFVSLFGASGEELFAQAQRLRAEIKKKNVDAFYNAKTIIQVPLDVTSFLSQLRRGGMGILNGEIEDLCKDPFLMGEGKKLTLGKLFEINRRLSAGEAIDQLFHVEEVRDFLEGVF